MGERLKDEHRWPKPAPDDVVTMRVVAVAETPPPVQPVRPPPCPSWAPWVHPQL